MELYRFCCYAAEKIKEKKSLNHFMVNNYVLYCSHNTYNLKCYLETDRQKWLNDVN